MLFFVFVRGNYFCNVFTVRYIQCRYLFSIEERWYWRAFRLAGSAVHFVRWRWKRKTSCPIAWSLLQRGDTVGKIMLISRSVVIFCHLFCLNIRGLALHWILWFPHEQINGDVIVVTPESLCLVILPVNVSLIAFLFTMKLFVIAETIPVSSS